jgi:hypothetical protein
MSSIPDEVIGVISNQQKSFNMREWMSMGSFSSDIFPKPISKQLFRYTRNYNNKIGTISTRNTIRKEKSFPSILSIELGQITVKVPHLNNSIMSISICL